MLNSFIALLYRDLKIGMRQLSDSAMMIGFFSMGILLFPLALGSDAALLSQVAVGAIWILILLSFIMMQMRVFQEDETHGVLDQLFLSPYPLFLLLGAKIFAHWLLNLVPILLLLPVAIILFGLDIWLLPYILISIILATPSLSLIGAVATILSLGARMGGVLNVIVMLPLSIPILVFAVGLISAAAQNMPVHSYIIFLIGYFLFNLCLCPPLCAVALRHNR